MRSPAGSRSSGPLISDLLTLFSCLFIFLRVFYSMSQKTQMSKQLMSVISTICQKSGLFPGIKAAQSSDAVPRIGGLKISVFIMEANQISAAVCLQAKEI